MILKSNAVFGHVVPEYVFLAILMDHVIKLRGSVSFVLGGRRDQAYFNAFIFQDSSRAGSRSNGWADALEKAMQAAEK